MRIFNHKFKGYNIHDSEVRVYILDQKDNTILIIIEDLGIGTSVTNSIEQLAKEITQKEKLDPKLICWASIYPYYEDSADVIHLSYDEWSEKFHTPEFRECGKDLLDLIKRTINDQKKKEEKISIQQDEKSSQE